VGVRRCHSPRAHSVMCFGAEPVEPPSAQPLSRRKSHDLRRSDAFSMPMILSLAWTQMKMSPAEAITAATINAAYSLNFGNKIGSLERGQAWFACTVNALFWQNSNSMSQLAAFF
jgi:hypothetical protein